jgi:purine-nucleoside phosphorylase
MTYYDQVAEAADFLRAILRPFKSRVSIVLGSGIGAVADSVADPVVVPYAEIPHFPRSTVEGHTGRIVAGLLAEVPVVVMQGRVHFYEGYTPQQVTFPMRVLGLLGIQSVILTNAAGGIHESYSQGQLVLLKDHINLMGWNPLVGQNEPRFAVKPRAGLRFPPSGLRFTDMTEAYSKRLRSLAQAAAAEGETLDEGVYLAVSGPSFETPAEIRAFRALGATLVGMSTVPETIVARHMGIEVLALSCVTNLAAGMGATTLSHEEVFETGRQVEQRLAGLLQRLVPKIAALPAALAQTAAEAAES